MKMSVGRTLLLSLAVSICGFQPQVVAAQTVSTWRLLDGGPEYGGLGNFPAITGQPGTPPARVEAATWTSPTGQLWMFGGRGSNPTTPGTSPRSDLWRYDTATGLWYWMGGSKDLNAPPMYPPNVGQPGSPGARRDAATWVDGSGNFWMFGGNGIGMPTPNGHTNGVLNDLWKLDPTTATWTYEGGPTVPYDSGVYPHSHQMQGYPPARQGAATGVTPSGEFLLFGGVHSLGNIINYNDLWRYSPAQRTWTWIGGSSAFGAVGIYPTNVGEEGYPGARTGMAFASDNQRNLWIFGGQGFSNTQTSSQLNDLWKYDIQTATFRYMGGSKALRQVTTYPTNYNEPGTLGGRNSASAWFANDKLWVFGGFGPAPSTGRWNDLWAYDPLDTTWRFMDGKKGETDGSYPTPPDDQGTPMGRMSAQTWTVNDRLYLYGGSDGATPMSDMWVRSAVPNSAVTDWALFEQ